MYCNDCRYDLRDLVVRRCPECGRVFHPDNRFSYRPEAYGPSPLSRHRLKYNLIIAYWWLLLILVVCPYVILPTFFLFDIITGKRVGF